MGAFRGQLFRSETLWALFLLLSAFGCDGGRDGAEESAGAEPASAVPSRGSDEAEVTALAHEFMEALSDRNTFRLDELMAAHASLFSIREGDSGPLYGVRTRAEFLEGLAEGGPAFVERIWEPTVEVSGRIAMVWAPYDFHVDGALSHCGIDVLAFMKLDEGWKVTSITYNVVREGCPPSPLGEPGG